MNDSLVFIFFSLFLFFYVWNIPVTLAFIVRPGGKGFGAGAFVYEGAVRRAQRNALSRSAEKKRRLPDGKIRVIYYLYRKAFVDQIFIDGILNAHDAALTALFSGAVRAIASAVPEKIEANVIPDFGYGITRISVSGILWIRLGHIILAGTTLMKLWIREKYEKWKSTRLKGS